ncbi:hypothetical protein CPB86DRAFT_177484 [Serendipita vermifera]|nr:hypothetical protein CPB86DRAFT_177484 [Serendipita vermifera]
MTRALLGLSLVHLCAALSFGESLFDGDFGVPSSGNALWYRAPANNWVLESLPIGNGYLGAAVYGGNANDTIILNIDSLWQGGPFADPDYKGANWDASDAPLVHERLAQLRATIFQNGTAPDLNNLTTDAGQYGTFTTAGTLYISRTSQNYTNYRRWLDMDKGIIRSSWTEGQTKYRREYACSYPDKICSVRMSSSASMNEIVIGVSPTSDHSNITDSCQGNSTIIHRGQAGANGAGMTYEVIGTVKASGKSRTTTSCSNGVLTIQNATDFWFVWSGDTEYDINAGTAADNYSFRGADPHSKLTPTLSATNSLTYSNFLKRQVNDYSQGTRTSFSLDLGQRADYDRSTDELLVAYQASQLNGQTSDKGRTLLEWLLFNYGRHLMFSSARGNLPANLQGVWSFGSWAPWSGDYHANINVQMMYWPVEATGMDITQTLWDFIQKTVVPRGSETAQILYNVSSGWAMHDETNIFGSTGMKGLDIPNYNPAEWTNYPAAGAWLMTHVWDHFDYTGDVDWLRRQGYPLLKVTAQFWLEALQNDGYTKDNSLVAVPCNSPELPQTTFGCTHWQQLIWELFNAVEKSLSVLNLPSENAFLSEIKQKRQRLYRGLDIGSKGEIQEWRLDLDNSERLTHRHLSHLVGLYPSYSISSFDPQTDGVKSGNLTKQNLIAAANVALNLRGNGTSPDADAGWGKIWRAGSWAQLGDSTRFYNQLSYGVSRNFASNLFSLYNPFNTAENTLFQMDANGGYPAAVLNALIQAPDTHSLSSTLAISILPALPSSWCEGELRGVRLRRGLEVDIKWSRGKLTKAVVKAPRLLSGKSLTVVVTIPGRQKQLTLRRGDSVNVA